MRLTYAHFGTRWWAAASAVGLALALQWAIIFSYRFDGLYGQDAFAYYDYALQVWESARRFTLPPLFYWPMGYSALVAVGFLVTGFSPLAGQIVSSAAGAGVVLMTYLLARDLFSRQGMPAETARWVGVLAGLLAAASGQLWLWSITVMSDAAALFWATLAAWALVRYGAGWHLRWLVLAAFALAWALMTRWIYGLLVAPFGVYWFLDLRSHMADHHPSSFVVPGLLLPILHILVAGLVGLAVLTPQIALTAANPASLVGHQWVVGWSPFNALRSEFETVDGRAVYRFPVALFYARPAVSPDYFFPLFSPFFVLGLGVTLWRRWWFVIALLVGWGAVIYGFLSGIPYENYRFTLALLPVVVVLTAVGLQQCWGWLAARWRLLLLIYILAGLVGGVWYSSRNLGDFIGHKQADLNVARWVEGQVPAGSRVLAFGITLTLQHYTPLEVYEFFLLDPQSLQDLLSDGRPTYLVVEVDDLERQWVGHPPEQNYRWLRAGPGLEPIGMQAGYTLFRVGTKLYRH